MPITKERFLKFSFPIEESAQVAESVSVNPEFLIKGTAITETTTRNGHKFVAEELSKSANTLRNKPILKDHENKVDNIVGRTTDNVSFDSNTKSIKFEAKIIDKKIQEMIKEGLITNVSVGAYVREYEENSEAKEVILRGVDFVELSLVAVPADPNASFAKAAYELKEKEEKTMEQEAKIEIPATPDPVQEELKKVKAELDEFRKKEERAKLESEIRAKVEAEVKAKYDKVATKVVEEEVRPKAQVVSESTEVKTVLKTFGFDSETGDKQGIGIMYYDAEMFKVLGGRNQRKVI